MTKNYFKKMSNIMRLWGIPVILGISLMLSGLGIAFIFDLKILAFVISGFIFLSGLLGVIYVHTNKKRFDGQSFYLILAILDFVLAFLLLTVLEIKIVTLSLMLSLWITSQGLGKIIFSLDIQKMGVRNWDFDLSTGILFVVYGIASIFLMSLSPAFIILITAIVLSLTGLFQIVISFGRQVEYKNYMRAKKFVPAKESQSKVSSKKLVPLSGI